MMNWSKFLNVSIFAFLVFFLSCNKGPKIIPLGEQDDILSSSTGINIGSQDQAGEIASQNSTGIDDDIHTVKIVEVLPTDEYVYLKVTEDEEIYWIATQKMDVQVGNYYFYKGSILQSNFKSQVYNRTFQEIFLVSELIPVDHGSEYSNDPIAEKGQKNYDTGNQVNDISIEGSIRIAELVAEPEKYGGKSVQISGKCVKVNAEIMGRNWIHLKDGSQDDFDLVITSEEMVTEGQIVTMKGVVGLDRNFGSGYVYDIIIEDGKVIKKLY